MIRQHRLAATALAVLACGLTAPAHASAAAGLTTGFLDDQYLAGASAENVSWLERARSVDAQMVRLNLRWSEVAPQRPPDPGAAADPAWAGYRWSAMDAALRAATSRGLRVLLTFSSAPAWAEGSNRPRSLRAGGWRPSASALKVFATAAARRYSGSFPDPRGGGAFPRVNAWQAWNEPNLSLYLAPQWVRRRGRWQPSSPVLYRRLLNAVYVGVHAAQRRPTIVSAGTAPYGDPPGGVRMRPVEFTREFLCLRGRKLRRRPCPNPARFDALAHHPYSVGPPKQHAINPDDASVPDLGRLTRVLRAAERSGRALPRGRKALWVTEISWDSAPPDPLGVPVARHAQWLQESFYRLWRQGARVILWLGITDHAPTPRYDDTYQSGVFFVDGRPKPAAIAFRFPFAGRCAKRRCSVWGRSPIAGAPVMIERSTRAGWTVVRNFKPARDGVFNGYVALRRPYTVRARVGADTSLPWRQR